MNQLQSNLYTLLKELDEICRKNEVEYYLAGGTALGAVRGGGFLPWDDDIDLYITRDNWDKLVKVMETQTPENRVFVCVENDPIYCNPVGRYVDCGSTVMMKSTMLSAKACGQLIEFFVMDPMPLGEEAKMEHRKKVKVYTELLSPYFVLNRNTIYQNVDFDFDLYNAYLKRYESEGKEKVLEEILSEIKANSEEECDAYCMRWGQRTLMYGKELLGEPRQVRFEDDDFPVPAKQEAVARVAYGDSWMYVPSGTGQVVHDLNKDLETPFQQYVDIYMQYIDKEKTYQAFEKNKRVRASGLPVKEEFYWQFATARAKIAAQSISHAGRSAAELLKLLADGDYEQLNEELQFFYSEQSHPEVKRNGILLPVADDYLYIAIMNLIRQGKYFNAGFMLRFREDQEKPLSPELEEAKALHQFCHDLSVAIYDEFDSERVRELLNMHASYQGEVPDYSYAQLYLTAESGDYEKLLSDAKIASLLWSEKGEIIRYEAYALYQLGKEEEAKERYLLAINNTRNGYVWKEAKELCGLDAYEIVDNNSMDLFDHFEAAEKEGEEDKAIMKDGKEND